MSDNLRRYRAIRNALTQAYPTAPTGNFARHLQTLAALISGIVGSKSTQASITASATLCFSRWTERRGCHLHRF